MDFSKEEIEEFKNESRELLDEAERHLLSLEKEGDFTKTYDAVFRVFHSLKGGAGMLNLLELQTHMHQLENHYQQCKPLQSLSKETVSYFLSGVDAARTLLDGGKVSFTYNLPENAPVQPSTTNTQVAVAAASQKPLAGSALDKWKETLGTTKVMIIDDEQEIVSYLKDLLEKTSFTAVGYTSPEEALNHLSSEKPDVVITDIKMGELSGFDVLQRINQVNPDLPVIFVSGFITKELIIDALSFGVFAAIEKPFVDSRVIELCTNASQRYQLHKLLNQLISFVYYQYSDLEDHWKAKGGDPLLQHMQSEFRALLEARRQLKFLKKQSKN